MIFISQVVKNEIIERIEKILHNGDKYSKKEFEVIINKIMLDIEKREKNKNVVYELDKPIKKKQLSSYNLFIKEQVPTLQGTSIERFKYASKLWNEKKEQK
jgi:uncharacterized membrane-anchored protein